MFDLGLEEELLLLQESAQRFAQAELLPVMREAERARGVSASVRSSAAAIGLDRLALPEELGGSGLGCLARAIVNEELAAADPGAALACDSFGPAVHALLALPDAELRELVTPLPDRNARCVVVDRSDGQIEVGPEGANGEIAWVASDRVDLLAILCREEIFFLREGIKTAPVHGAGLRAAGASSVVLADVPIAARVTDPRAVSRARAGCRIYIASLMLGVMRQACEYSRAYAREREAFGRAIAHHQALAFLITDMHAAVEGVRVLVHDAAWRLDDGEAGEIEAAQAMVEAIEVSCFIGPNAVQLLGGHGFMRDHPVEKYMREVRALGLLLGGVDAAREEAGRAICERPTALELCVERKV